MTLFNLYSIIIPTNIAPFMGSVALRYNIDDGWILG